MLVSNALGAAAPKAQAIHAPAPEAAVPRSSGPRWRPIVALVLLAAIILGGSVAAYRARTSALRSDTAELAPRYLELLEHGLFATVSLAAALFFAGYLRQRERLGHALGEVAQAHALQAAEQRFRATFEQAAVGLCHVDAQGRLLRVNALCGQLLGLNEEQLLNLQLFDLLLVEGAQRDVLQAALEGRRPQFSTDVRARRGQELRGWLRLTVSAVREAGGSVAYAVVVLDDISTRKAAAYALEQSEARIRSYTEHAPLGVVVIDRLGRIQEANAAALALSGHTATQIWLQPVDELLNEHGRPLSRFASRPLLRTGKWSFEAELTRHDGSRRWISASAARMNDGCTIAFVQDITARKHEERALRQAHAVFRNTQEGLVITDARGDIVATNPAFSRITGYTESELLGRNMKLVNSGRHDPAFYRQFWHALAENGFWQGEIWNRRKNGEVYPEWLTINAVHGPGGELQNYVAACMDITRTKQSEMELERLAHHDALTGLPNRLLLMNTLEHAIARAQRNNGRGAVLMLDLDRFKNVNDSLGHPAGDQLLQEVAQRLSARLRGVDTVARLGGDEFVVLLEELAEPQGAAHVAQALIDACSVPFTVDGGQQVYVGASVGISLFPDDSIQGDRLIQQADAALYNAKDAGRGTYRFFTGAFTREARIRLDMESGLRRALDEHQFSLHYQPLVRADDGRIEGMEALVRWRHPELGVVSPGDFIPLAEETGLIVPLGDWVLRTACAQMRRWQDEGVAPRMVAVNLSPRQFAQADLVQQIERVLLETGLSPSALELEITESALMDATTAGQRLQRLKALGVRLAIDDFGTGYSSLAYLSRFPIDKLKVDQSFVRRIPEDTTDMEITAAVISLARSLKLKVLGEGVETPEQLQFLRKHGCDLLQGYLFAQPLPVERMTALLRAGEPLGPAAARVVQQAA
jgi:diguanylate cyclase (GGDEF)-like protein/PAS domain S-box-containing protein